MVMQQGELQLDCDAHGEIRGAVAKVIAAKNRRDAAAARATGALAEQACVGKARRTKGFDVDGALEWTVRLLKIDGPTSGEDLVEKLKTRGFVGHDDRCFGAVFGTLSRRKQIRCVGYCARKRGHGTAGGRIWEAV
jgi:hypothetical protein